MSFRILRSLYHVTVYAIGIVVLLAAVSVTLIRLVLPDIGIYRGEVEAWVSRYMGFPVVIRSMNATWYGWIPYLHLTNIDLLNKAETQTITHFESAQISIDPIASLLERRIIPKHLTISGFELSVAHLSNGAIYIEGINVGDTDDEQPAKSELAEWLFKQEKIEIQDATVEWIDVKFHQEPILLSGVSLKLRSDGSRIQVEGSTALPPLYGKRMDFAFDARGDLLTSGWSGELYMNAHDINPDNWYRSYRPAGLNIAGGAADIKVWSTWNEARLVQLDGELQYNDFAALFGDSRLRVDQLSYRFHGTRNAKGGWRFNMNLSDILTENGIWPDANVAVLAEPADGSKYRYVISFDYLKLDDVTPVMSYLSFVPESARTVLADRRVNGALRDGRIRYDPQADAAHQFHYDVTVEDFSARLGGDRPRLSGSAAHISGTLDRGEIRFNGDSASLHLPALDLRNVQLAGLTGTVAWQQQAGAWSANTRDLHVAAPGVAADLSGRIEKPAGDAPPFADLAAVIGPGDIEQIAALIPRTDRFRLRDWLQRTVTAGQLVSANAVLRGDLANFPFEDHSGRFGALIQVANGTLDYSDHWPPVDGISAEINIDGKQMVADIHTARIFGAEVFNTRATIDDIRYRQKLLDLGGRIRGATHDLELFIEQSPLGRDIVMRKLGTALTGGEVDLDLNLKIPIRIPDRTTEAEGVLRLADAGLRSEIRDLELNGLNGEIQFTRDSAVGTGLRGSFFGEPVEVDIRGSKSDTSAPPRVRIRGKADLAFISARLNEFMPGPNAFRDGLIDRMSGSAGWEFIYSIQREEQGESVARAIEIKSDLYGLALDLPAPLGKDAESISPFSLARVIREDAPADMRLRYGPSLLAVLGMNADEPGKLEGVAIAFDAPMPEASPEPGLTITGNVPALPASEWWPVFRKEPASTHDGPSLLERGLNVSVNVGWLDMFDRTFQDTNVSAADTPAGWQVDMDGADIAGRIDLPADHEAGAPVVIALDRLHLSGVTTADSEKAAARRLDPRRLPAMVLNVASLQYNGNDLGTLMMEASPIDEGLSIDKFEFQKPGMLLSGNGNWLISQDSELSDFNVALHAENFGDMLETFGYNLAAIQKGETDLKIEAVWEGSPMEFSLASLTGSLEMEIKKGQLLDVEPAAGRLFGLLSLQSLPRRLSLDFSDLFGKGLAFDSIQGSFEIANGQAYTNDLRLIGPSADVVVTGRTGLEDHDYDQIVTVTPQIAGTLPVASVLFGPVGMGVGAVIYLAGEMFGTLDSIDRALRYQYTITGSWNSPVIEKYKIPGEISG